LEIGLLRTATVLSDIKFKTESHVVAELWSQPQAHCTIP